MKVLMTADAVGGVWTYALELAKALAPHDVEIVLATMGTPPSAEQRREAEALSNVELQVSDFDLEWMDDPWEDVALAGDWLLQLEQDAAPDLIHLNGYVHGSLRWESPVVMVAHSCVLSWWQAVQHEKAPPRYDKYATAVSEGLRWASIVVAPTAAMMQELDRTYGVGVAGAVVPNGRDASLFRTHQKEPFIFSAGRLWDPAKNLQALEAVAPDLPWPVKVAGDSSYSTNTATTHEVESLGRLGPWDLSNWFACASIYALPARYEPFGLSALEAALSQCALVLGDISSLREVWGDAAMFVPPDDTRLLRAALMRLIEDSDLRQAMGLRARHRASHFSLQRMAAGYLAVYDFALARRPATASR